MKLLKTLRIGNRSVHKIILSLFESRHWYCLFNIMRKSCNPYDFIKRYIFAKGSYPVEMHIKNGMNKINVTAYSRNDILTINEIFFREDYYTPKDSKTVVDVGSNIGISALYFLNKSPCHIYMYEPVPDNLKKIYQNMAPHIDRCTISPNAIDQQEGLADFGLEESGRYGGLGLDLEKTIQVKTLAINDELKKILKNSKMIDILKIDIENKELEILKSIDKNLLKSIKYIHLEYATDMNFTPDNFVISKRGDIYTFKNTLLA